MSSAINGEVECEMIGDFTDDVSTSQSFPVAKLPEGEIAPTQMLAECTDDASSFAGDKANERNFIVLLRPLQHPLSVRGHAVRYVSNGPMSMGSYAIAARDGTQEILVAIFQASEVIGIYESESAADDDKDT